MEMGSSSLGAPGASGSNDSLHGLKFGKKIYFEDVGSGGSGASSKAPATDRPAPASAGSSTSGSKKGRGAVQGGQQQPPRCQVEGCKEDLTGAKAYYCRHKVCGMHSKSPKVIVAGMEQRFCQQCSRFHQLSEFDQGKRSCRRRLAGHNERRRKPPPTSLSSRYGRLSTSFHEDGGRFGGFLMDFTYPRLPGNARDVWPTVRASDQVTRNPWSGGLDAPPSSRVMTQVMHHPYGQGPAGGSLFSDQEIQPSECLGVSDSSCALSLLSNQPWGTNAASSRAQMISANNFEGTSMAQSSISTGFVNNLWTFKGHESSGSAHEISPEMGLGLAAESSNGHFSGELELALQGNRQCMNHGHGRSYGPSGNGMHWSL